MKKKGISLIVLIITIIVIIILAGAVILNLSKNNPIDSAKKAKFLNDVDTFKSDLSLYELGKMSNTNGNYDAKLLNADKSGSYENGAKQKNEEIKIDDIITSMENTNYPDKLEVISGELVYVGDSQKESSWCDGVIESKDFKIDATVVPTEASLDLTVNLTGAFVDVSKIDYYRIYISDTSGSYPETYIKEIKEKSSTVSYSITEGIEANKTYYIKVEVKMDNLADVRQKEIKVVSTVDSVVPNAAQISMSNYSNNLIITPIAVTLSDNDGGSGINKTGSKYIIDKISTNYTETDVAWNTATAFSATDYVGNVATLALEVPTDGEYYLHVLAVDSANNKKSSTSGKIIVDTTVPNEANITIPGTTTTSSVQATVTMSDNTNGSGLDLNNCKYIYSTVSTPYGDTEEIWNTAEVFTSATQTITVTSSTNEVYYLHVLLVDNAGNRREVLSSGVTTNTDIPVAPVITGTITSNTWTNSNVTLTVNEVTSTGIARYEYNINDGAWQTYNSTNKIVVSTEGTTYIKARAVNNVGTNGAESAGYVVNIDKTSPTVAFGTNGGTVTSQASTIVTVNDSGSGVNTSTLQYVWDTQNSTTPSSGWNTFTSGSTLTNTNLGNYYLWIKVNDNLGNATITKSVVFQINDTPDTSNANAPVLAPGMTPIKWDVNGNIVATTSSDSSWYNYSNKHWANAQTADGSMWVWIPRYEYKIPTPHTSTAQTIAVNFVSGTGTSTTSGYTMHTAFTFGSTQLTGIWVAKFEASGTTTAVDVKPNVVSLRSLKIDAMFTACRNMETNSKYGWGTSGSGFDTHLMKNIEWGAAAYLSNSIYGKNSEVWINPNKSFITGQAGTSVSASGTADTYAYNNVTYGVNASTTGNMYGVYDMSGGADEYTAAYVNNGSSDLTTYGSSLVNSAAQYKDIYTKGATDDYVANYSANSSKKGDAVYETSANGGLKIDANTIKINSSWYGDQSFMPNSSEIVYGPFFGRGDYCYGSATAGLFAFDCYPGGTGNADGSYGFRPVLVVSAAL